VDGYPSEVTLLGLPVQWWIRTSLVVLPYRTLAALGRLALPVEDERIFGGVDAFFRDDAPLSENYKGFIRAWLFGEDCAGWSEVYGRWHSTRPLTPESLADFRAKARSILCEHYLSARLRKLGVAVSRVN
jgi:hypothetical protein